MTAENQKSRGEIILYESPDGGIELDVRLEQETLWLSLNQLTELLGRDKSVISRHLRNIFKEGELSRKATVAKKATAQTEGGRQVTRSVEYFNLDAIISVGYRVNSKRGTQFRIWATRILRDHIVQGYTVNPSRLLDLNQAVKLIADTAKRRELSGDEAKALLAVVSDYNRALELPDGYDHQRVSRPDTKGTVTHPLEYDEALRIVDDCGASLPSRICSGVKRTRDLKAPWGQSCRPSEAKRSIRVWRRKRLICSISWSRIMPSSMATSG
ncbi:MAG: hypothetical protein ACI8QI_002345 [Limisphaerales bacterium]|jgi:hypothetical protein